MDNEKLIELLLDARCPNPSCDGFGAAEGVDQETQEVDTIPCKWCHERAELLDRDDLLSPPVDPNEWLDDPEELPF